MHCEKIICSAIRLWERTGQASAASRLVHGFEYVNENNVDILALQVRREDSTTFERIGRGRIVAKEWLKTCSKAEISIW
jgi:hypothetical protein